MSLRFGSVKYTGDGTDNRDLTSGFSFPVALFWTKPADTTANDGAMSWSAMGSDKSFDPSGSATPGANMIQAFNPGGVNGVQLGSSDNVNKNGTDYYSVAINGDSTCFYQGSYTGNGTTSNPVTGVGFQPDLLFVRRDGGSAGRFYIRNSDQASTWSAANGSAGFFTMDSDGFTVTSTSSQVNTSGSTYYYVAIKFETGFSEAGSFTGNATDNRDITTTFNPEGVIMKANSGAQPPVFRTTANTGDDTSSWLSTTANFADGVQSLGTNKFTVGTNATVNRNATTMTWMAFRDNPPVSAGGDFFLMFDDII